MIVLMQYVALVPVYAQAPTSKYSMGEGSAQSMRPCLSSTSLSDWSFRKTHTIAACPGAGANYQVRFVVSWGSGNDSGSNVFCNSKCRSDFGDIRFAGADGATELHYWREDYKASSSAVFWVRVEDNLSAADVKIFMYYGNSAVDTTSNGSETFLFFDDFNGTAGSNPDTSKWTIIPGVGVKLDGAGDIRFDDAGASNRGGINGPWFGPYTVSALSRVWCSSSLMRNMVWNAFWDGAGDAVTSWTGYAANNLHCVSGVNYSETQSDATIALNSWHIYETKWFLGHAYWYVDQNQIIHHTTNIPSKPLYVTMGEGTGSPGTYFLADWIAVRKCALTEPQNGMWGAEEASVTISHPADVHMNETDTGRSIAWVLSGFYPASYEVRRNVTEIASGPWNSTGEDVSVSLDGLSPGVYIYNATVINVGGKSVSDFVTVTVDRVPAWWETSGTSITITIGCLVVIVVVSGLICRTRR
jgi:hypothetical protein